MLQPPKLLAVIVSGESFHGAGVGSGNRTLGDGCFRDSQTSQQVCKQEINPTIILELVIRDQTNYKIK